MRRDLISLAEAAQLFPVKVGGKHLTTRAIQRRITRGIQGVRLRGVRDGRSWYTTEEWVADFQRELTQAAQPVMHPADRQEHAEHVKAELKRRFGIEC